VLRAQNLGISVTGILIMLAMFNLIYSLVSTLPAHFPIGLADGD